ncbi:mechanosensitive ion channel family protein [Caproiciproducens faecalis]|uniref:Mechanosensitive ion channel family protein n=1 Tax=Caproiciproducens faecalis TaxID=2820301 RepID=A0ABS7DKE2_9FIRM|nr:mechanosensitive ion channel family protein [Caproiciproducens faecalis]MBW7571759.1 mechanosensitive ion channel family protein [Caproiciproducens faecalis]
MGFSFEKYSQNFLLLLESSLPKLFGALLILAIGWWLSNQVVRLMFRAMSRSKTDTGFVTFISSLTKVLLKTIVCITAAAQLGMNVGSIIAAVGAAGLTIGLAVKDNMANIACGAQIIFTKPFRVGDYILFEETEGTVERIETMFTTLRTFDNKEVVIPNAKITSGVIVNYSAMATRRLDLKYLVGYDEDLAEVKNLLRELVEQNPMALTSPAPLIVVGEHRDSGITVEVRVWCKTQDYLTLYFAMQEKVKLAFDKAGIRIPYNQLDVHVKPGE